MLRQPQRRRTRTFDRRACIRARGRFRCAENVPRLAHNSLTGRRCHCNSPCAPPPFATRGACIGTETGVGFRGTWMPRPRQRRRIRDTTWNANVLQNVHDFEDWHGENGKRASACRPDRSCDAQDLWTFESPRVPRVVVADASRLAHSQTEPRQRLLSSTQHADPGTARRVAAAR